LTFKEFGLLILCGWHNHPQLIVLIFVLKMSNIQIFNCQNNTNFPEEIEAYKDFSLQDRDGEVWKDIYDYEGLYQISNHGRVKSLRRVIKTKDRRLFELSEKIINVNNKGHVRLTKIKKQSYRSVKILIRESFYNAKYRIRKSSENRINKKYLGVFQRPQFTVTMIIDGKNTYIGAFNDELEAAKAYDDFIIKHDLKRKGNFIDNR
jgi:hypothetical protein